MILSRRSATSGADRSHAPTIAFTKGAWPEAISDSTHATSSCSRPTSGSASTWTQPVTGTPAAASAASTSLS